MEIHSLITECFKIIINIKLYLLLLPGLYLLFFCAHAILHAQSVKHRQSATLFLHYRPTIPLRDRDHAQETLPLFLL